MKKKFYVVWKGRETGIFHSWEDCEKQTKGFEGAKFKSFNNLNEAKNAFSHSSDAYFSKNNKKKNIFDNCSNPPILESICVDGAHSSKTHLGEYQGVYLKTGEQLFYKDSLFGGSNNLMEFLALVHALALCKQKGWKVPIYSDSRTAIAWVNDKKVNTNIIKTDKNQEIFDLVTRAIFWLKHNNYENRILKWDTENWGENPADFGRK